MSTKYITTGRFFFAPRVNITRRESGQSLVEFALMLPLLLLLLIGVIEIGRYAYIAILVGNAARAGAAYGSQTHITAADQTGIIAAADNDFQNNGQNVSTLNVTKTYACGCDNAGTISVTDCTSGICPTGQNKVVSLQVTASFMFSSLFNYPGIPSPITVARTATMRIGA
jgi:Flp pilus assembly protein TadG